MYIYTCVYLQVLACCIAVSKLESAVRQSEDVPHVHHHRHVHHAAGAKTCNKTQQHPAAFDPTQAPDGHKDTQPDAYNHAGIGTAADGPVLAAAAAPVSQARQAQLGDLVSLDSIKGPLLASVDGLFGLWSASSSG